MFPLVAGIASFMMKDEGVARKWALLVSIATLALMIVGLKVANGPEQHAFSASWMGSMGSSFSIRLDGMAQMLCLLTAIAYPLIFLATWRTVCRKAHHFFGLMLLTQAGLMGVFMAVDALLFYFFWELALIPVYFLCSQWGGERRIAVTFKFFIYTFTASVLMLIGLLFVYFQTPDRSFAIESFYNITLPNKTQTLVFWLLFVAFAVKMPVFPFHTWQPDTYEQSPTAATMVLSGLMVKMGVFGVIRWVLPVVPLAAYSWGDVVMSLGVTGVIYASVIAIQQNDLKRLIAYSSIAHIGVMATAIFAESESALQGVLMQMFNHGINIIGLWIVVELIERQFGTRKLSELGGMAQKAPALAILLVIIAFANISLPLTNAFVGEFLMFNGIFNSEVTKYSFVFTVLAGLSIILGAVYTLNMVQKIFFGTTGTLTAQTKDIWTNERIALALIVLMVLVFGVYPQPLLDMTRGFASTILKESDITQLMIK